MVQNLKEKFSKHPDYSAVKKVFHKIKEAGFEVLYAGGCVRDAILGILPKDFDLATNATPDQIEKLFPKTISVGKAFGVIIVLEKPEIDGTQNPNSVQIEVATFRSDGNYKDGRRPESILFSSKKEDAFRRDFTINALFYDEITNEVFDFVGGFEDLKFKKIRTVGLADLRFQEDHLRIVRALRFVSQFGFEIESETWEKIIQKIHLIHDVSPERLKEEMTKFLQGTYLEIAFPLLVQSQALKVLFPGFNVPNFEKLLKKWKSDKSSLEILWIFFWLEWSRVNQLDCEQKIKRLVERFRFSNAEKNQFREALFWIEPGNHLKYLLSQKTKGELLEKLFSKGSVEGFEFFLDELSSQVRMDSLTAANNDENSKILEIGKELLNSWKGFQNQKPVAWIQSTDLLSIWQGKMLGENLKKVYWAQLEGIVKSKEDGLRFLGL